MSSDNSKVLHTLLTLSNTKCFLLEDTNKNLIGEGTLNVTLTDENELFFYIPEIFQYVISKEIPSMKASNHSFVFPLINQQCWGLVLSENCDNDDLKMFEDLLMQFSQYEILQEQQINPYIIEEQKEGNMLNSQIPTPEQQEEPQDLREEKDDKITQMGQTIADYIDKGSILIQKGILNGTSFLIHNIHQKKEDVKLRINVREDKPVSNETKDKIRYAENASKAAVKISSLIYNKGKYGYNQLSKMIINMALNSNTLKNLKNNNQTSYEASKKIGKSTLLSIILLHETLEKSALTLINELSKASVDVTQYKYGEQIGKEAQNISNIVMNSATSMKNLSRVSLSWYPLAKNIVGNLVVEEAQVNNSNPQLIDNQQQDHLKSQ